MARKIDPYSYGLGMEHGTELNRDIETRLAHSLALIEDSFREVQAGRKSAVEMYFEMRTVFDV